MPSNSDDDITPLDSWRQERRNDAVDAFTARIPAIYTGAIKLHQDALNWATGWADCPSLFLTGPIGVGKTHTAWQASRLWIETWFAHGRPGAPDVECWRSTALFDSLRPESGGSSKALVTQLQRAELLFIDDLAAARVSPTGWTQERLYEIFDERYINRRPVLITCDVLPHEISHIVSDRVASRLAEMCRGGVLLLEGADRRKGAAA